MAGKVRLWAALGVGVALSLLGVAAALSAPPLRYQATSQVVLLLPPNARTEARAASPFLYLPDGLTILARACVLSARGDGFRQELVSNGFVSTYEIDAEIRSPIIRFSVEGDSPTVVNADLAQVVRAFSEVAESTQRDVGAPDRHFATVRQFDLVGATPVSGDRRRAAVGVALVGTFLTVFTVMRLQRGRVQDLLPQRPASTVARSQATTADSGQAGPGRRFGRHRAPPREPFGSWHVPAVLFLIIYAALLLLIPSRLGVAAIGGPGKPASLWALLAIAVWVVLAASGLTRRSPQMRVAAAVFGLAAAASYVAGNVVGWYQAADIHQRSDSRWRLVSLPELNEVMISAGDRGLLATAGWLGVVLVTAEGMRSWRDLELLVTWVVRCAAVVAALGVVQYFTNINVAAMIQIPGLSTAVEFTTFTRSVLNRVVSTAGHPIELGVNMAALLPLALHRSLHMKKPLAWVPTVLLALMVLMSVSRSAVVVAVCAGAVLFWGWPNRWRVGALLALPVLAVAGRAALPGLLGTIRGLFQNIEGDPSVDGRTQDYPHVISALTENPWFGKGVYTWGSYYYRTLDNQVLVSLLELGLVGVVAFLALIGTAVTCGLRCRRFTSDARQRHLGLALAASIVGMTVSYATFDTLAFNQAAGLSFLLMGMAGAAFRLAGEERTGNQAGGRAQPVCPSDRMEA